MEEQLGEAVYRAAIAQIANHGDLQAVEPAQLVADGEEVEQRLCGMLARAVTGVDDRDRGVIRRCLRRADFRVAQDDDATVLLQRAHGINRKSTRLNSSHVKISY